MTLCLQSVTRLSMKEGISKMYVVGPKHGKQVTMCSTSIQSDAVPFHHMDYRRLLKTLDDGLGSDDCNKLRFIVADLDIPKSQLEKCQHATDIFDELEKRAYISVNDVGLLWTLMELIHRKDLLRKIESHCGSVKYATPINGSGMISKFRLLLLEIADNTSHAELEQIKHACRDLGRQAVGKCQDIYQIFSILEERGKLGPNNLGFLVELLQLVQNADMQFKVLSFNGIKVGAPGPTEVELVELSSRLGYEWQKVATYLGVAYHKVQAIIRDVRSTEEQIRTMLFAWRRTLSPQDNGYAILANSLRKCGRVDLAEMVKSWSIVQSNPVPFPLHTAGPIAQPTQHDTRYIPPGLVEPQVKLMKPSDFYGPFSSTPSIKTGLQEHGSLQSSSGCGDHSFLDKIFRDLSEHIVVEWMKMGTYLGLQHCILLRIDRDYSNSEDKSYMMLKNWCQGQKPGTDVLRVLASVLKVVGRLDLSERLKGVTRPTEFLTQELGTTNVQHESYTVAENTTEAIKQQGTCMEIDPVEVRLGPASNNLPCVISQQESFPEYPMTHNPRGLCMIINNEQFFKDPRTGRKLSPRIGSEKDAGKLDNLFTKLHFMVEVRNNLTSHEMIEWFKNVSQINHSDFDCFACCILSHGELEFVYGSDSNKVELQDVFGCFKGVSCPSLIDKPKLFFIQACRGTVNQEGVDLQTDDPASTPRTLPNEADFLMSYATVPGYTSFRSKKSGSVYINFLVDEITKYHNEQDLLRILLRVNDKLSDWSGKIKGIFVKQVSAPTFTLRKALYLRRLLPKTSLVGSASKHSTC